MLAKWFGQKAPLPVPTYEEALRADLMLAIAEKYRTGTDGSLIERAILRGAADKIEKQYRPILERWKLERSKAVNNG